MAEELKRKESGLNQLNTNHNTMVTLAFILLCAMFAGFGFLAAMLVFT